MLHELYPDKYTFTRRKFKNAESSKIRVTCKKYIKYPYSTSYNAFNK